MMYIKKLLGIGHHPKPVLMENVDPAPQDPQHQERVNSAVGELIGSLANLERRSYALRRELSHMSLHIVAERPSRQPRPRKK